MKINLNLTPLFISFDTAKTHLSFGFYYKLELYTDHLCLKPKLVTRKVGYKWFFANCSKKPKNVETYEQMINRWNGVA